MAEEERGPEGMPEGTSAPTSNTQGQCANAVSLTEIIQQALQGVVQAQVQEALASQGIHRGDRQGRSVSPRKAKRKCSPSLHRSEYRERSSSRVKARYRISSSESERESSPRRASRGHVHHRSPADAESSLSLSESEREEGELSGEDDQDLGLSNRVDRLCPTEMYNRVLAKAAQVLDLEMPTAPLRPSTPASRAKSYPDTPKPIPVPFPEQLKRVFAKEWEALPHGKQHNRLIDRFYTLPEPIMDKLKVPRVDAPVVAVSAATTLPSEGESGPKDSCDKKVEAVLKRNFECGAQAFRVVSTTSIFARAAYVWAEELAAEDRSLSRRARSTLKKIALASAAAADSAYDALHVSARSMATGVMARRHIWLRQWEGDAGSSSRIINLPFKGGKLFGEDLEPLLVENQDKLKVLPSSKKAPSKKPSSFRPYSNTYRGQPGWSRYQGRSKPRWDKGKPQYRGKRTGTTSQAGKPSKDGNAA